PVTQLEPFPVDEEYPAEVAGVAMGSYLEWMRACSRISATGCPAISIPAGLSAAGLPVGLQLVARPFAERALLEVAHAVDTQTGYSLRVPPAAVVASVAVVERRDTIGGVCANTGTIPSKTLREAAVYLTGLSERGLYGQ